MITVIIQNVTTFICEEVATTKSDIEGEIINKWDLFQQVGEETKLVGTLVEHTDGNYATLHPTIDARYIFAKSEVVFNVY